MLHTELLNKLINIRRELHANPEISNSEFNTQKRIVEYLNSECNAEVQNIGKTGVLATFTSDLNGPTIMFRGDIDALPITETNTFKHASKVTGVSHKCGHDGHTTILLGLAKLLSTNKITKGKVLLLFQPAEENGTGAQAVLNDHNFNQKIDFAFALHNLPGFNLHEIVVKENEFTANVKSIIIKLNGKTSHAAEPEKGQNPSLAIAEILSFADSITNNKPEETDFFLMTPKFATLGDLAYGISAGYGEVHFTIRTWSTNLMSQRSDDIERYIENVCSNHNLFPQIAFTEVFHANVNDQKSVQFIRKAAQKNNFTIIEREYPFKWGEDFGLFTQKFKGAMFGIGAGLDSPALHNPDYDFPDEIIETGIRMFYQIIQEIL